MVKIKTGLFEAIACCTILPSAGVIFTTLIAIISLIGKQINNVGIIIGISYAVCVVIFVLSLVICFIYHHFSKNELVIDNEKIVYQGKEYPVEDIYSCTYYKCRWYAIPLIYFYKQQQGGTFVISFEEEDITVQIRYCDYKKIQKIIPSINTK